MKGLTPKTLTTRLIPFNLRAVVIDHDESADPALEPGDVITIFSDADIRVPRVAADESMFALKANLCMLESIARFLVKPSVNS